VPLGWPYICSQLGFTKSFCLLLQVSVLGLAGFMHSSSGLLPRPEPGRPKMRTRGVVPLSGGLHIDMGHPGVRVCVELFCFSCDTVVKALCPNRAPSWPAVGQGVCLSCAFGCVVHHKASCIWFLGLVSLINWIMFSLINLIQ
jgi:hypothetical protein